MSRDNSRLTASTSSLPLQGQSSSTRMVPTPLGRSHTSRQADLRANSGVMSVWGKLSSNASAAFSVVQDAVQDAYSGVARDIKTLGNGEIEKTSELRTRESLRTWGEEEERLGPAVPASSVPAMDPAINPWATSRTRTLPPFDNPWSSVRTLPTRRTNQITSRGLYDEPRPYPSDPNIPASLLSAETSRSTVQRLQDTPKADPLSRGSLPEDSNTSSTTPQPSSDIDPLGVGLI